MRDFKFVKYSGAGNDFVIFLQKDLGSKALTDEEIIQICHRKFGVGSDGLIILSDSEKSDFEMEYFNADGKPGSLCGNGARCAIKHASESGLFSRESTIFNVGKEKYSGKVLSDTIIKFNLKPPLHLKKNFKIKAKDQLIESAFADTGSPHIVINCCDVLIQSNDPKSTYNNIDNFPVLELGREIRHHKDFAPNGTNVNFIEIKDDCIKIRTFERGVEAETLACGTGSVAVSLIAGLKYNFHSPIKIKTLSGDELVVEFNLEGIEFTNISLTGPAKKIFEGKILL